MKNLECNSVIPKNNGQVLLDKKGNSKIRLAAAIIQSKFCILIHIFLEDFQVPGTLCSISYFKWYSSCSNFFYVLGNNLHFAWLEYISPPFFFLVHLQQNNEKATIKKENKSNWESCLGLNILKQSFLWRREKRKSNAYGMNQKMGRKLRGGP